MPTQDGSWSVFIYTYINIYKKTSYFNCTAGMLFFYFIKYLFMGSMSSFYLK